MKRAILVFLVQFLFASIAWASPNVVVIKIKGPIGPAVLDYFQHGLDAAVERKAAALIVTLDTQGGLESSVRSINELILSSAIPVISYVAPTGARAMSAGTYIMYASHLSMMADGTTMGAATPVELSMPYVEEKNSLSTKQQKMMQNAIAYIKSLANLRGRNAEWAVSAVTTSAAITAIEAKRLNVINAIANDFSALLKNSNGQFVTVRGVSHKVQVDNASLTMFEPGWRYELLSWITDPNIAYLLLVLAMYAIVIELLHPGLILPGVTGVVSLIVALYAFQLMPLNYAGFALILTGAACMVAEIFLSSMGALAIAGLIAFVAGSLMIFDTAQSEYRVALSVIIGMALLSGAFFLLLVGYLIKAQRRKVVTGQEALLYQEGVVVSNQQGKLIVKMMGDQWNATANNTVPVGALVRVIAINGLVLLVEQINKGKGNGD